MAVKKLIYTIEVIGTEAQVKKLTDLEKELYKVTKKRNELLVKQNEGIGLTKREESSLVGLTQKQKELSNSKAKLNQEINRTINAQKAQVNTLRSVNAELAIQRQKIQDVVIGSKEYQQIARRIKELENLQRNYNQEIGRGRTFVGEYAKGAINAFSRVGVAVAGVMGIYTTFNSVIGKSLMINKQAERAEFLLAAAIRNRGDSTKLTTKDLEAAASALSKAGSAGRTDILKGVTTQLLTFRNISDEIFKDVQKTVLDVATVLSPDGNLDFGQLKTVAIQLGKALNEPEQALSALTRSGIQFSMQQKTMIKDLFASGHQLEAQKLILEEVNRQYGTAYEQTARGSGQFQQVGKAIKGLQREFGRIVADYLAPLAGQLADSIRQLTGWFKAHADTIVRVAKVLGILTGGYLAYRTIVWTVAKAQAAYNTVMVTAAFLKTAFTKAVKVNTTVIMTEAGAIETATVAQKGLNTAMKANPIGLVIGLVTALISVLTMLPKRMTAAEKSQQAYNDALKQVKDPIIEEKTELEYLLKVAANEKRSREERTDAIAKMNEILPDTIRQITEETIQTGQAAAVIRDYVAAKIEEAKQQAYINRLKEIGIELAAIEDGTYESKLTFFQKLQGWVNPAIKGQLDYINSTANVVKHEQELQQEQERINKQLGIATKSTYNYTEAVNKWAETTGVQIIQTEQSTVAIDKETAARQRAVKQTEILAQMSLAELEELKNYIEEAGDEGAELEDELVGVTVKMIEKTIKEKEKLADQSEKQYEQQVKQEDQLHKLRVDNIQDEAAKAVISEQLQYEEQVKTYQKEVKDQKTRDALIEQEGIRHQIAMQGIVKKYGINEATQKELLNVSRDNMNEWIDQVTGIIEDAQFLKTIEGIYKAEIGKIEALIAGELAAEQQRWDDSQVLYADNLLAYEQAYREHLARMEEIRVAGEAAKAIQQPFELPEEQAIAEPEVEAIIAGEEAKLAILKAYQDKGVEVLDGSLRQRKQIIDAWYAAGKISAEQYNASVTAIDEIAAKSRETIVTSTLQGLVQVFGEASKIGRAAVIAEKAYAVAEATIALIKGMAKSAGAAPFPANLALIAGFITTTAGLIASIKAVKTPEIEAPKVRVSKFAKGKAPKDQYQPNNGRGMIITGVGSDTSDNINAKLSPKEAVINAKSMQEDDVLTVTGTPKEIASHINAYKGYGIPFAMGKAPIITAPSPVVINRQAGNVTEELVTRIVRETVAGIVNIPVIVEEKAITRKQRIVNVVESQGDF